VDVTRGDLLSAGTYTPLRSNDAIHLATALRLGVDEILTYDEELATAAERAGIRVSAPAPS
jgi:predicted nucleic acid-binding protein